MQTTTREPGAVYRQDYSPADFTISTVDLSFELGEEESVVSSCLQLQRLGAADAPLVLHGEGLELRSVMIDGQELRADAREVTDEELRIPDVPDSFSLRIVVAIKPQLNTSLSGLYKSSGNFCTQCEAMGFRHITYFLDRPDIMCTYQCRIVADRERYPVLLSNGNRIKEEDLGDGRHAVQWQDPFPKPSYLFALVAGNLHAHRGQFTTMSGRTVDLEIWVEPQNADKCEHALQSLQKSMAWDELEFGREYDLDLYMIVAVNDFNMGAMENKGLNIFNSKYVLARPDTATDDDYEGIEGVIAHEYFHNWTGNRVTCRDWFQLTLKEGLTVFRDQQFTADMTSALVKRIDDVRGLRISQFQEDAGPMSHPIRPESYISMDNFYTATVYIKGAEVIRMYHTLLGKEGFRKGMDLYFDRHDGQAVTCDDFLAAMADANARDLEQFGHWYQQRGTPRVSVSGEYDADAQTYTLHVQQSLPVLGDNEEHFLPLHIPIAIGLLDASGNDMDLGEGAQNEGKERTLVYELTAMEDNVTFSNISERPVLSLGRHFSAPVRFDYDASVDDQVFLMAHDCDGFNRWQAAQDLARRYLHQAIAVADPAVFEWPGSYFEAFGHVLSDRDIDGSFKALMLQLPAERELAQDFEVVDVDAIHTARKSLRSALAATFHGQMQELYDSLQDDGPYSNDQASVHRRRLKNTLLGYLCCDGDEQSLALAEQQYQSATNMTDSQAALQCIAQHATDVSQQVLDDFYQRWQDDPLVMDKWFTVQAMSQRDDCLQQVQRLQEHSQFTWDNPNRVRALVSAFVIGNPLHFHAADGSGYALLRDAVERLQSRNPQLAARLVSGFNQWKRYDSRRQQLQREALSSIAAIDGLSKDVYEIVHRALEH